MLKLYSVKVFTVPHLLICFVNDADRGVKARTVIAIVLSWLHLYDRELLGCGSCLGLETSNWFVSWVRLVVVRVHPNRHSLSSKSAARKKPINHTSLVDPSTLVSSSLELEKTVSLAYDHFGSTCDGYCTPHRPVKVECE